MPSAEAIADALLSIQAVQFRPQEPVKFKSGILSPVYVDNRQLPAYPDQWQVIIQGLEKLIQTNDISFDMLAGVETAGIPHASALGYHMHRPSLFVRKQPKEHGKKKRVEGNVEGKTVLLVEDHVSTASSSLDAGIALREEGGIMTDCLAITTYGFAEADAAFITAGVKLHALATFSIVVEVAVERGILTTADQKVIEGWFTDPHGCRPGNSSEPR